MLLAIDNGNTNVKFAVIDGAGAIRHRWRIATDARRTADGGRSLGVSEAASRPPRAVPAGPRRPCRTKRLSDNP